MTQFLLIALVVTGVILGAVVGYLFLRARSDSRGGGALSESERSELHQRDREIAAIRDRIEEMYHRQQVGSDTQTAILNQQIEQMQHNMQARARQVEGLQSQLRHEIQQREVAMDELRAQLSEAVRAITSAGALTAGSAASAPALLEAPTQERKPAMAGHVPSQEGGRQPSVEAMPPATSTASHVNHQPGSESVATEDAGPAFAEEIRWVRNAESEAAARAIADHEDAARTGKADSEELSPPAVSEDDQPFGMADEDSGIEMADPFARATYSGRSPAGTFIEDHAAADDSSFGSDMDDDDSFSWEPVELDFDDRAMDGGDESDVFLSLFEESSDDSPLAQSYVEDQAEPFVEGLPKTFVADTGRDSNVYEADEDVSFTPASDYLDDIVEGPVADATRAVASDPWSGQDERPPAEEEDDPLAGLVQWTHGEVPSSPAAPPSPPIHRADPPQASAIDPFETAVPIGGDGSMSRVPEPLAPKAKPEGAEDLTTLPMIDAQRQQVLYSMGIHLIEEIARWSRADARRVSEAISGISEEEIMNEWVFSAQSVLFDRYQAQMRERRARPA